MDDAASIAVAEQPEPLESPRDKPVAITGAAGFVGTHVCRLLTQDGWKIRAIVRNPEKAAIRLGHLPVDVHVGDIRDVESMRAALVGAGTLVHLAAIAVEKPGQRYADTNTEATQILLDAARSGGADRIIYMSQNGADSKSPYEFLRSKGRAEDMVTRGANRWTVLRPSVIFGPEDEFVNVLGRLIRLTPVVFPLPGGGSARFQPVAVNDVARAVARTLRDPSTIGRSFSIGGSIPLTLRQMTERILVAMHARRLLFGVPVRAIRPLVALAGRVLPSPPVTTSLLDLLAIDNVIYRNDLTESLGVTPTPFAPEELLYLRKITFRNAIASLFRRE